MSIKLGLIVKDKVTGLIGVTENRSSYLHGCDRYFVQPKIDKDGKIPDGYMFDEPQLEILEGKKPAMEPYPEPPVIIQLGSIVLDPIKGLEGTATGRAVYLNGCARIYIEPKQIKDKSEIKPWWTEEQNLNIKKAVKPKAKKDDNGGPCASSKY